MLTVEEAQAALLVARATYERAARDLSEASRALVEARKAAAAEAERQHTLHTQRARRAARKLADELGVEIERHDDLESRPWFVSHPELEGEADPYEGDHYVHSWIGVLGRVQGYQRALEARQ